MNHADGTKASEGRPRTGRSLQPACCFVGDDDMLSGIDATGKSIEFGAVLRPSYWRGEVKRGRRIAAMAAGALLAVTAPAGASPVTRFGVPQMASRPAEPGQVEVRFMGTSTILLDDGSDQILIDGFFSRPNPLRFLFDRLEPNHRVIGEAMDRAGIRRPYRLRAVLVAHAHFDHVLDAPIIAEETKAWLVGSQSTLNVGRDRVPTDRLCLVRDGDRRRFGAFTVSIFWTPHGEPARYQGLTLAPPPVPAAADDFRDLGSLAFLIEHGDRAILVHPSTHFRPRMYRGRRADMVFLGIGQLGLRDEDFAGAYWNDVVRDTQADLVTPIHWDLFMFQARNRLWAAPWPADNVGRAMRWLRRFARSGPPLRMMPLFEPVAIEGELPPPVTPPPASTAAECEPQGSSG